MEIEKYSPKWLLEKINASKTDAHKLMHIIEYRKELVESTEKQFEEYARFCIECDRKGLKPIKYNDYLKIG